MLVLLQMIALHKDPAGNDIFKKSSVASSTSVINKEAVSRSDGEVQSLKRKIQELEREKDVRMLCVMNET